MFSWMVGQAEARDGHASARITGNAQK